MAELTTFQAIIFDAPCTKPLIKAQFPVSMHCKWPILYLEFMEWDLLLNCGDLLVPETTIVACHNMKKNKKSMQQEEVPLMKKDFVVFMR
jgi:hypothetical protein